MIERLDKLAAGLLRPINPSIIIVLGFYTILWGLWVINPFWSVFTHSGVYVVLATNGGEYIWGGIALVAGILIARGAIKPSYGNLIRGSFAGFLLWLTIGISYLVSDWASTGGITTLAFATYSLMVYLNIKVNKTYFQEHTKTNHSK